MEILHPFLCRKVSEACAVDQFPPMLWLRCVLCAFTGNFLDVRNEFIQALRSHQAAFGISLDDSTSERLADYFELIQKHNPLLHLVAPTSPEEFAIRHILESLTLVEYLPQNSRFADIGTGAGLPSIPCLIARADLCAVLIESKEKKTGFLTKAVGELDIASRVLVVNKQFEEVKERDFSHVTCRALDKFTEKLPRLLKWIGHRQSMFFAGPSLEGALLRSGIGFSKRLLPQSQQRYLFISK